MTSNGELRRGRLPHVSPAGELDPFAVHERGFLFGRTEAGRGAGAPSANPGTEERLAAIWCEVLGVARVRAGDTFFNLGGNSLAAVRLGARVADGLGVDLDRGWPFRSGSLAQLASEIDRRRGERPRECIPPAPRGDALPLSPGEERLWFSHRLDPASPSNNRAGSMRLRGRLQPEALVQALGWLVARHEILRTNIHQVAGRPFRAIGEPWPVALPLVDRSPSSSGSAGAADGWSVRPEAEEELRRILDREARKPFDLERDRLLRAVLVRLAPDDHVLGLVLHHIVCDGWSMGVLRRDLVDGYAAFVAGRTPAPAPLQIQVADHAAWQARQLGDPDQERQLAYWSRQLAGGPTALMLPRSSAARPQAPRSGVHTFVLPPGLARHLRTIARDHETTLFAVLLGALQVLLYRYTGQADIWIGTPVANRRLETEGLIGFLVNTVILRTRVAPRDSFPTHLARLKGILAEALASADVPFQRVVEQTRPERGRDQTAPFHVLYNHLEPGLASRSTFVAGLELGPVERAVYPADLDLVLDTSEDTSELRGVLSYRADRFDRDAIERLAVHYAALLASVVADRQVPVGSMPLLGEAELRVMLGAWNRTEDAELGRVLVPEAFARRAAEVPRAVAARSATRTVDYATLHERSSRWAHVLRGLGVGPDVLVGVCAEPSFELLVGLLAVLKSGGAYLPLDPSDPADRLAFMLDDARPPVVLAEARLRELVAGGGRQVLVFEDGPPFTERSGLDEDRETVAALRSDHLAYCMYTSGTTGVPKAALLTHGGLANHLAWMLATFGQGAAERVLQHAPVGFDASVRELWLPLISGGTCVLGGRDPARDPAALLRQIAGDEITLFQTVPSVLELLMRTPRWTETLGRLRCLVSGGEPLPSHLAARLVELPGVAVFNLYGPTETTIDATFWRLVAADGRARVPIGLPIANATAHVLDGDRNPVPIGGVGELHVGGVGLARGYLARPDFTAERFVPDPFSPVAGARLYRTGDLVRRRADGAIEYVERAATQGEPERADTQGERADTQGERADAQGEPGGRRPGEPA